VPARATLSGDLAFVQRTRHRADRDCTFGSQAAQDRQHAPSVFIGGCDRCVLWVNPATLETDIWLLNNGHWMASTTIGAHPAGYQIAGIGDFNQDGTSDVVWAGSSNNDIDVWLVNNGHWAGSAAIGSHPAAHRRPSRAYALRASRDDPKGGN
jgi:hypothetical protein